MPEDDRRDIVALAGDLGRECRAEPETHDGDLGRAALAAELLDRYAEVASPRRDPTRIALVARGVARAVEVEPEHGEARSAQVLGEMTKGAMRSNVVVAERIAQHHGRGT